VDARRRSPTARRSVAPRARAIPRRRSPPVDVETKREIGAHLRALREERHLTQAALADTAFTAAFVSMVESGRALPSMKSLLHFAKRLRVPIRQMLPPRL
jgi:DNA-binding XRE family transcriptional regulator